MQLHHHRDELDPPRIRPAVITFSAPSYVAAWRKETGVDFPILLDPDRKVYRLYRLERSWARSWNLPTIWRYARLLTSGRRWRGIQGDSAQLGADFLVSPHGNLLMVHYSLDPTDRPAIQEILAHAPPSA